MTQMTITGRLVQGDVYRQSQRVDNNNKKVFNADGTPQMQTYFAVAVAKGDPKLAEVEATLQRDAAGYWPGGETRRADFAWKIIDGDSTAVNKSNKQWNAYEGFAGHKVFKFGSLYPCKVQYWDGGQRKWVDSPGGHVALGDYVSVAFDTASNKSTQTPGIHLNPSLVGFERKGDPIAAAAADPDGNDVFGQRGGGAPGEPAPAASPAAPAATAPNLPTAAPGSDAPAYMGYMDPPAPPVPAGPQMTAKANGASYESFTAKGWTDDMLRQHGYML